MIAYKYRLYPTREQQKLMWWQSNCINQLYNYFLEYKKYIYVTEKRILGYKDLNLMLTQLKRQNLEYYKIYAQTLQQSFRRLLEAYDRVFTCNCGFPKYRSCKHFFGLLYPQKGYQITKKCINFSKIGLIKYYQHRIYRGNIKQVYIKCDQYNRWWVIITTDYNKPKNTKNNKIIGLDIGISKLVTLSNGDWIGKMPHVHHFNQIIDNLKKKRDKQCKYGSRRYKYLSEVIRKLYEKKYRKICDYLHNISKYLADNYEIVVVEDLTSKKMSESKFTKLNREIRDSCWSRLINYLEQKTTQLIKINPKNTSKKCSRCGMLHNMPLNIRILKCSCGLNLDRDHNAAINILCLGQAKVSNRIL